MRCGKPRILMIDDNVADIGLVRAVLDDSDNTVELYSVRDGIEGITYLKHAENSGRPDHDYNGYQYATHGWPPSLDPDQGRS